MANNGNGNGNGQVVVNGGSGSTTVQATATSTKINGGDGNDLILGGSQVDDIRAGNGNDTIVGGAGNDIIFGNDGYDVAKIADLSTLSIANGQGGTLIATSSDGVDTLKHIEAISDGTNSYVVGQNNGVYGLGASAATTENNALTFNAFAAAFDVEDDAFSIVSATNSAAGASVSFTAGGSITYTPGALFDHLAAGATATDTFSYTVKDAAGNSTVQTVTVTLTGTNDAPTITGGSTSGAVGEDGTLTASGSLTATDVDNGATQSWSVQGGGSGNYGSLSVNGSGGWNYALANGSGAVQALAAGQTVSDSFTVQVSDGNGGTDSEVVSVTIAGANDAPAITGGATSGAVSEDGTLTASGSLTATDVDSGATQAWSVQGGGGGTYGSLSVNGSGGWSYALANGSTAVQSLASGQTVSDSFTIEVSDGNGGTDSEVVNVTIAGANDAPTITGGTTSGSVSEDNVLTATGSLTAADVDNGDSFSWTVQGGGSGTYGALSVDGSGGWSYALANGSNAVQALATGQSVTDSFTVEVSDGKGGTDTQAITISVAGQNEAAPSGNLLVDFEDMNSFFIPQGYKGFTWDSPYGTSGFVSGEVISVTSQVNQPPGTDWIWSNGGISPFIITRTNGADFDFVGTWAADHFTTSLVIKAFDDGQLVGSITATIGAAVYIPANFTSIDRLEFHSQGNFAFDNMLFNI